MKQKKSFILLIFSIFIYSLTSIFSKFASYQVFLSKEYIFYMCLVVLTLGVYALIYQQTLKLLPLSTAMSFKPLALILNIVWAFLIFNETISLKTLSGIILILIGLLIIGLNYES